MTAPPQRRILDSHVHVWPNAQPGRPYPWPSAPDPHPAEALLPVLDKAGVAAAIQVTPVMLGFDNRYGIVAAERHHDRIAVFGRLDVDAPGVRDRLLSWMAHPAALGVRLTFLESKPAVEHPFWADAEELGVPVAVFAPGSLDAVVEVAERHPRLRLVVDHLGLDVYGAEPYRDQRRLSALVACECVRVKISGLVETSSEPFPFRDVHDHLARAHALFGAERLIWGSNYPVVLNTCSYAESLEFVYECGVFSDDDLDQVLAGTFDALTAERNGCASPS